MLLRLLPTDYLFLVPNTLRLANIVFRQVPASVHSSSFPIAHADSAEHRVGFNPDISQNQSIYKL